MLHHYCTETDIDIPLGWFTRSVTVEDMFLTFPNYIKLNCGHPIASRADQQALYLLSGLNAARRESA